MLKVICPKCQSESVQIAPLLIRCAGCDGEYEIVDGIPVLLPDVTLKTALEEIDYNKIHGIDEKTIRHIYAGWKNVFAQYLPLNARVLEIGSGTGALTIGMAQSGDFEEVAATDVSLKFLLGVKHQLKHLSNIEYVVCDGNNPPFAPSQFDIVVGRSILHHLIDYKTTLARCKSMLKDGGVAIFFEPVLQGKAIIALMIDLMLKMDRSFRLKVFTKEETKKLEHLVRHQTKSAWLPFSVERYSQMEDKYIFHVEEMKELGRELGFTSVEFVNNTQKTDASYKSYLRAHLKIIDIPDEKINSFQGIFDAFEETWGAVLSNSLTTPMGYFIFKK